MNKEWSQLHKTMQAEMKKEVSFSKGIADFCLLRDELMDELCRFRETLQREDFNAIPFMYADGYHSKTIAYSIWHIFRIEDIVAHTLIKGDEQIFFAGNYQKRISAPIITTGNELVTRQIASFSTMLELEELYQYIADVKESTEEIVRSLSYADLKRKMTDEDKKRLQALSVVSADENACWLVDYWCKKDVRGLINMPFSRHWIMHVEACLRIETRICP